MSAEDEQYKRKLIERYLAGEASEKELQAFFGLLTEAEIDGLIEAHMDQEILRLREEQGLLKPVKRLRIWRYAAIVSGILILSYSGYFFFHKKQLAQQIAGNQIHEFKPGGNKAILTLSNGHAISLTDAKNGKVALQGNTIVKKTGAGLIEYAAVKNNSTNSVEPIYNTLSTPRGGRFEGLLPDGTHVILDAASSIKYQVNITGKDRLVWITGQVHFNVIYNSNRPFYVNVKGQVMKDLGTSFNVNAYDDEPVIRVTLEEGSINISKGQQSAVLIPGQQAITKTSNDFIKVQPVNVNDVLAWTKGQTSFQDEGIREIMRKVSRWYDVDVQYEGQIPTQQFDGSISRDANLSDLLKVLEFDNVHFKVDGKTIIVQP